MLRGILYPIICHKLSEEIGFVWTVRAIRLVNLVTLIIPLAVSRIRVKPDWKGKALDLSAFIEPISTYFIVGGLFTFVSLNISFFYIQYFATTASPKARNGLLPFTHHSDGLRLKAHLLQPLYKPSRAIQHCLGVHCHMRRSDVSLINLPNITGLVIVALLYRIFSECICIAASDVVCEAVTGPHAD